jgi:histidinol dehydrogenase
MPQRLSISQSDFAAALRRLLELRDGATSQVGAAVTSIIRQVRSEGDVALMRLTTQYDRFDATADTLRVSPQDIAGALSLCTPELMKSLRVAARRIEEYSRRQMPADLDYTDELGVRLGHRWSALQSVGLYVPGGLAAYPSSVLMNAIPARVAGVHRIVMVVPAPEGRLNPALLAAAHVAGIEEIYKIGGAQAVAALAYGTATIAPVDKIVGPGNAYVAEAKRQVFGTVGIDMIAGPSEILVISDASSNPAWIAADLLSQAEHDEIAQSILITDNAAYADKVCAAVDSALATLARKDIARAAWERYGAVIVVNSMEEACAIANTIAPEHLELAVDNAEALLPQIAHAGAIFVGRHTPEAIGDYIAGPSHVLPTSRTARFSSGLSVFDFIKRTSLIGCSEQALAQLSEYTEVLATAEGLGAHALSVTVRRPAGS